MTLFDEVKAQADLIELGRRRGLDWKRAGKLHKACCPFHSEKTPSFTAFTDDQRPGYKCFGCGWNGSAVDFVMQMDRIDDPVAAARVVASECGITLPDSGPRDPQAEQAAQAERELQTAVLRALDLAAAYYAKALTQDDPTAVRCRAYLEARGLGEAVEPWGLGYAPGKKGLVRWLEGQGVPRAVRVAAGLTAEADEGYEYLRLRDRLIVPLRDARGAVRGFAGRLVDIEEE